MQTLFQIIFKGNSFGHFSWEIYRSFTARQSFRHYSNLPLTTRYRVNSHHHIICFKLIKPNTWCHYYKNVTSSNIYANILCCLFYIIHTNYLRCYRDFRLSASGRSGQFHLTLKYNLFLIPFLIPCFTINLRFHYSHCNEITPLVIKLYRRLRYSHCNKTTPPKAYKSGVTMLVLSVTIHSLEPWDPKFFPTGLLHTSYYCLLFVCNIPTLPISTKQQWGGHLVGKLSIIHLFLNIGIETQIGICHQS